MMPRARATFALISTPILLLLVAPLQGQATGAKPRLSETIHDEIGRFTGLYGDPVHQGSTPRNIAITLTCDGHLAFGAAWGDVAPWALKRLSATEFEQAHLGPYDPEPIRIAFELDGNGGPIALTHNLKRRFRIPSRLVRLGELPESFRAGDCEG
jgi:hypothetical protein